MNPWLGPEEKTLRWKGQTSLSERWRVRTSGERSARSDAIGVLRASTG
jgi:hypothetical protein